MAVKKYLSFIAAVVLISGLFFIWKFNLFTVKDVDVTTKAVECATKQQLKDALALAGQNIFFLDTNVLRKKLLSNYLCLKDIQIKTQISGNIQVEVAGRAPSFRLLLSPKHNLNLDSLEATPSSSTALIDWSLPSFANSHFFRADETGFIFDAGEKKDIPIVVIEEEKLAIGQQLDPDVFLKASILLSKLESLQILNQDKSDIKAKLAGKTLLVVNWPKIAFSLEGDPLKQLASLQLILQKAKIDGKTMDTIDLRFDKPVVIYSSQENGKR